MKTILKDIAIIASSFFIALLTLAIVFLMAKWVSDNV